MAGTRNKAVDLVNLLFEQMEDLAEAGPEELDDALRRADGMSKVAQQINATYANSIKAAQMREETGRSVPLLRGSGDEV